MTDHPDELWIVRHGETEWSAAGRHTSTTDLPLTPEGEEVARALGERLADVRFDLVLTSPRQRARRTAELAGFPDAHVEDDLAEWAYGDYEGLTSAQIRVADPDWTIWSRPCPGGESAESVSTRADHVLAAVRSGGQRALIFGHGHFLRALTARWLGASVGYGRWFRLDPSTISVLGHEHRDPVILRWNS
jgi:probable phosphoglycerate mutase